MMERRVREADLRADQRRVALKWGIEVKGGAGGFSEEGGGRQRSGAGP